MSRAAGSLSGLTGQNHLDPRPPTCAKLASGRALRCSASMAPAFNLDARRVSTARVTATDSRPSRSSGDGPAPAVNATVTASDAAWAR